MLKVKYRQTELILTEADIIKYIRGNYILITQKYHKNYYDHNYELAKSTVKKLIKDGEIVLKYSKTNEEGEIFDYYKIK